MSKIITTKLENICVKKKGSLISGPFGSNISSKFFVEEGVPVIRGNNLYLSYEKFNDDGFVFVTPKKADELNCYAYREDLIFTAAGTIGQVGLIPNDSKYEEYVISNKQIRARIDQSIVDVKYAYYWFCSPWMQKCLMNNNKGSTVPLLTLGEVRDLQISYPESLDEQRRIVECIEYISKKIEINNKINDNLQKQLTLIFDYFFNNSRHSKVFTNGVLADISYITMGQSPSGDTYNENGAGIPFYQGSTDFGKIFPTIRVYTTEPSRKACLLDTLMSVRAPVGTMNIAYENCCIGRGLAAIRGKNNNNTFVRYLLKRNKWYFDAINNSGTTFGSITKDYLYEMPVIIPDTESLAKFEDIAQPYEKNIFRNETETRALSKLRDWLLPMLMNGQLVISD